MVAPRLDPISAEFDAFVMAIADIQADYIKTEGKRYLQVLRSSAKVPSDDKAEPCEWRKPAHRQIGIADTAAVLPASSRCQFEVHEYLGPHGLGYVVFGYVMVDGVVFKRAHHVGRDPGHRSHDWEIQEPPDTEIARRREGSYL